MSESLSGNPHVIADTSDPRTRAALDELQRRNDKQAEEISHLRQLLVAFLWRADGKTLFPAEEMGYAAEPVILGEVNHPDGSLTLWAERE